MSKVYLVIQEIFDSETATYETIIEGFLDIETAKEFLENKQQEIIKEFPYIKNHEKYDNKIGYTNYEMDYTYIYVDIYIEEKEIR